jgi:CMP-N,N'-diacetyllegionaminic acid synthase
VRVLVLVPARGGSRGLPRKNVREFAGKPLIAWTIEAALAARRVERTVVTTDDPEIAAIAGRFGAEVPFLRPPELAADDTSDLPVYHHALGWLAEHDGYRPDAVAWLRPTAPLRTPQDIDAAIEVLERSEADSVRSVCAAEYHPYWMKRLEGNRLVPLMDGADEATYPRRQLLPEVYRLNGAVDAVRCAAVTEDGPLFGGTTAAYLMPRERSIDIDDELDLAMAELLAARKQ